MEDGGDGDLHGGPIYTVGHENIAPPPLAGHRHCIVRCRRRSRVEPDRLVSFVDFAPTMCSLAGVKPPEWMQGHAFAGKFQEPPQPFIYGFRGRMDERRDVVQQRARADRERQAVRLDFVGGPHYSIVLTGEPLMTGASVVQNATRAVRGKSRPPP